MLFAVNIIMSVLIVKGVVDKCGGCILSKDHIKQRAGSLFYLLFLKDWYLSQLAVRLTTQDFKPFPRGQH